MNRSEIVKFLTTRNRAETAALFRLADEVRKKYVGDEVHLRGLIEFSNCCARNCLYCGLRAGNVGAVRYRMEPDEIVSCAAVAVKLQLPTVVLQSGEDSYYSIDTLCDIVRRIKRLGRAVTLSLGERSYGDYARLKEAGADRYLMRFETSDAGLYAELRPGRTLEQRLCSLRILKELGYQTGSGIMVGLPGQTPESIADDIFLFKSLELDMIGIGPFIPHPDTPLAGANKASLDLALRTVALARIVTEKTHIPATTAVGSVAADGRRQALMCGANVIMPNITPVKYRKFYEIYPDKICTGDDADKCRGCAAAMIAAAGRKVGTGFGHSLMHGFNGISEKK